MKITLDITKHISILKSIVSLASQMTVPEYLSYIYVGCSKRTLTLQSTNLEATKFCTITLDQEYPDFKSLIHHQALAQVLAIFTGTISIDFVKGIISQGSTKIHFKTLDPNSFPEIKVGTNKAPSDTPVWDESEIADLKKSIDICLPCVSTEVSRIRLCTINLKSSGGNMFMQATNGHVLAKIRLVKPSYTDFDCLIPSSSIKHISSFLATTAFPTIFLDAGHIVLSDITQTVAVRLIQEVFPDIDAIIPKPSDDAINFSITDELRQAVRQVQKVASDSACLLHIDQHNRFFVHGKTATGELVYEWKDEEYDEDKEPHKALFQTSYLSNTINHTDVGQQMNEHTPLMCRSNDDKVLLLSMARRTS